MCRSWWWRSARSAAQRETGSRRKCTRAGQSTARPVEDARGTTVGNGDRARTCQNTCSRQSQVIESVGTVQRRGAGVDNEVCPSHATESVPPLVSTLALMVAVCVSSSSPGMPGLSDRLSAPPTPVEVIGCIDGNVVTRIERQCGCGCTRHGDRRTDGDVARLDTRWQPDLRW